MASPSGPVGGGARDALSPWKVSADFLPCHENTILGGRAVNRWACRGHLCQSVSLAASVPRKRGAGGCGCGCWHPPALGLLSSLCVVSFLQSVIVTPWAQSMSAVMAQDSVSVRREPRGLSVMSVCRAIPGTPAVDVSNWGAALARCSMAPPACLAGRAALRAEKGPARTLTSLEGYLSLSRHPASSDWH